MLWYKEYKEMSEQELFSKQLLRFLASKTALFITSGLFLVFIPRTERLLEIRAIVTSDIL